MAQRETIFRHFKIIHLLRTRNKATFEEIEKYLERESNMMGYDLKVSKRTFQRDIQDIASIYNIEIVCDRKDNSRYFIKEYDGNPQLSNYILESFELFSAFNANPDLNDFIMLETRRPKGTENLYGLVHAIRNQLEVQFLYHKFGENESESRHVYPLGLKESIGRWYLLAYCVKKKEMRTFGIDRISSLEISNKKFNYHLKETLKLKYEHCFGIVTPNDNSNPEQIEISFTAYQGKYIKSFPLHHSQQIITDNEKELRISLFIYPTHDFFMELLKYTSEINSISPQSVRDYYLGLLSRNKVLST